MARPKVALLSMPWAMATRPSIALGILKSVLNREGIPSAVRSYHLAFADHLASSGATPGTSRPLRDYMEIAERYTMVGGGDWCFAVPPYRAPSPARDRAYLEALRDHAPAEAVELLQRVRAQVPSFLDECAREIVEMAPKVVGFTCTFFQTVPSLALARMLKERLPGTAIVFGGSSCDGEMGAALHRSFPWVDVVVRGEGEHVFLPLVRRLLAGEALEGHPGLCFRRAGVTIEVPEAEGTVPLEDVPAPDYDEYFDRVARSALGPDLRDSIAVPLETARGCWWGAKHHCTFCGLNPRTIAFRSKSPPRVIDEIRELTSRYRCLNLYVVDNIVDMAYLSSVFPALRDSGWNLRLFFETKSNLKRADVKALAEAGVRSIQPGIESLSTPVLRLMRKGVSALLNIRLLKYCAEYDITPEWNLLHGFPGETSEAYTETAAIIPSLVHLCPPRWGRLRIDRFSPFFSEGEGLGMRLSGPQWFYRHLYEVDTDTLRELAYFFDGEPTSALPKQDVYELVRRAIDGWWNAYDVGYRSLSYRIGPDFLVIVDRRPGMEKARYVLDELEARIYLACDAGASPAAVLRSLRDEADGVTIDEVRGFLDELVEARLVFREGDRYLGLAVAEDPEALDRAPSGRSATPDEPEPIAPLLVPLRRRPARRRDIAKAPAR